MNNFIKIKDQYITLGQLLKAVALISSGGQAKIFLVSHLVYVNGNPSRERGKKLFPGDSVSFEGQTWTIGGELDAPGKPEA